MRFNEITKFFRFVGWVIAVALVSILILVLVSQTTYFKSWLRQQLTDILSQNLNGTVSIGKLSGNLFTHFKVQEMLIAVDGDTVLFLPELRMNVDPRALLHSQVRVRLIAAENPVLNLTQQPDRSLTIQRLLPADQNQEPEPTGPFSWQVNIDDIRIRNATIHINLLEPPQAVPHTIRGLNAELGVSYRPPLVQLALRNMQFETLQPDFTLEQLTCDLLFSEEILEVQNLELKSGKTHLSGRLAMRLKEDAAMDFNLRAHPLDLAGLKPAFPHLAIRGKPTVALNGSISPDSLRFELHLEEGSQRLNLAGAIHQSADPMHYEFAGSFSSLDVRRWMTALEQDVRLNGALSVRGLGTELDSASVHYTLKLGKSDILGRTISRAVLSGTLHQGGLQSTVQAEADFGRLNLSLSGDRLAADRPDFRLQAAVRALNLGALLQDDSLDSDVNMDLLLAGSGKEAHRLQAGVDFRMRRSKLNGLRVDTLVCRGRFEDQQFQIDTFHAKTRLGELFLSGHISLEAENDVRFHGRLGNLRWVQRRLQADTLYAQGRFRGSVFGRLDSLQMKLSYQLQQLAYNALAIDSLNGWLQGTWSGQSISGRDTTFAKGLRVADVTIDSAAFGGRFEHNRLQFSLALAREDSIAGRLRGTLALDSLKTLTVSEFDLMVRGRRWRSGRPSMVMQFGEQEMLFRDVGLQSGRQSLSVSGRFAFEGEEDLRLQAHNIDIQQWITLFEMESNIKGRLQADIHFTGTATNPKLDGILEIVDGEISEFKFQKWSWDMEYENERLSWTFVLRRNQDRSLKGDGYLPINLSPVYEGERLYRDRPIRLQAATGGLDLSFIQTFSSKIKHLKGSFVCDVKIENTLADPRPIGFLRVLNGGFQVPEFGIAYDDIQVALTIDSSRIRIVQFDIGSGKGGLLSIKGTAEYDRRGLPYGLLYAELDFSAQNFEVTRHRNLQAVIDGKARLFGDLKNPRFDGHIRVSRARVYLPAFQESELFEEETPGPLIARSPDAGTDRPQGSHNEDEYTSAYLDNLEGALIIEILRNTWLKGPEMNVEIAGQLDIVKSGEEFEHFGTIRVLRGTYDLYGRRFEIQKGVFTFEGELEFNPRVEIEAQHVFRDLERQKRTLRVDITGRLFNPNLAFKLDDFVIEERDAIAYLLFRRSFDQLTQGERSELTQEGGLLNTGTAKSLLASLVAAQLSRTLGKQLNLDVIELQGDNDWRQATIIVGKYLTNDLFISYQRQFQLGESDEVVPEKVILEFEVAPFLLLQMTKGDQKSTGFDLIWKFQK